MSRVFRSSREVENGGVFSPHATKYFYCLNVVLQACQVKNDQEERKHATH